MQNEQTTGLRPMDNDYVTIVEQACDKVTGFDELYKEMERAISITGKSKSTLTNYSRQLTHLALHYDCFPLDLDGEQVMDYLHLVKSRGTTSATFFKFTVYGMRYACRLRGLEYKQYSLPAIEKEQKLPVVLNGTEVKALMAACKLLKHRLIIGLCYGCGLRCSEVRNLRLGDVDLERGMLHVKQSLPRLPSGGRVPKTVAFHWVKCFAVALVNILLRNIRVNICLKATRKNACRNAERNG